MTRPDALLQFIGICEKLKPSNHKTVGQVRAQAIRAGIMTAEDCIASVDFIPSAHSVVRAYGMALKELKESEGEFSERSDATPE